MATAIDQVRAAEIDQLRAALPVWAEECEIDDPDPTEDTSVTFRTKRGAVGLVGGGSVRDGVVNISSVVLYLPDEIEIQSSIVLHDIAQDILAVADRWDRASRELRRRSDVTEVTQ